MKSSQVKSREGGGAADKRPQNTNGTSTVDFKSRSATLSSEILEDETIAHVGLGFVLNTLTPPRFLHRGDGPARRGVPRSLFEKEGLNFAPRTSDSEALGRSGL